jgi:subfamily B ATP-binding cassette protein MsbA
LTLLGLQFGAVLSEGIGLGLIIPIVELVLADGDMAALREGSLVWGYVARAFATIGLQPSLEALCVGALLAIVGRQLFVFLNGWYRIRVRERAVHRLRVQLLDSYFNATTPEQETVRYGILVNEVLVETGRAVRTMIQFIRIIGSLLLISLYLGLMLLADSLATLVALAALAFTSMTVMPLLRRSRAASSRLVAANQEFGDFLLEWIRNARLLRLSSRVKRAVETTNARSDEQAERIKTLQVLIEQAALLIGIATAALCIGGIYIGHAVFDVPGTLLLGFIFAIFRLMPIMREILHDYQAMLSGMESFNVVHASLDRLADAKETIAGGEGKQWLDFSEEIEFQDVGYTYPNASQHAVDGLSFVLRKGDVLALVGPSGSGKSTSIDLLPGLRWPTSGRILIDGRPTHQYALESLRANFSYVSQNPLMPNISIREYARFERPDADDDSIRDALSRARALDFVERHPDGLDAKIGQNGNNFSGGQCQRLDLARALLSPAPILVLDEPSSQLDEDATRAFIDLIRSVELRYEKTVIIVTHDMAVANVADTIVQLRGGVTPRDVSRDFEMAGQH